MVLVWRPPHDQEPGQDVYEDSPDPGRHGVGLRGAEVNVEHHHRHTNTETSTSGTEGVREIYLKVSRIMVKRTNLPRRGTTREVGGMISASRRKNTVSESRMEMERLT